MREIYHFCCLFIFFTASIYPQNTFVSIANAAASFPGQKVNAPVSVANFNNIGAVTLKIKYDPAIIQFDSASRSPEFLSGANGGIITIARAEINPVIPTNGKLIDLYFTYLGGVTSLSFIERQCELTTTSGNILNGVTYIPGSCGAVDIGEVIAGSLSSTVVVPINVSDFSDIGALTLKIKYDTTVVRYDSLSRAPEYLSAASKGVLTVARADIKPVTPTDGKLLDLYFTYKGVVPH